MKFLLGFNILLLLLCAKSSLPSSTPEPSSPEPVELDFADLDNKFLCLQNETLDKNYVQFAHKNLGDGSFFAIAPNSMNKTLKFNVTISKYDSEAVGLEGFNRDGKVPKIVDADIKSEVDGQAYKWYANSCIPITGEMFGHKCSFGKEKVNCTFVAIGKPTFCSTQFKAECNIDGKPIKGLPSYDLLELKLRIKKWGKCSDTFSTNATELHLLVNKNITIPPNKKKKSAPLDNCVKEEILPSIPSLNATTNISVPSFSSSEGQSLASTTSALLTSPSNTTKVVGTTKPIKKSLSIKDCLTNPFLIVLILIFVGSLAALGYLLFRFFTKPKEPEKDAKVVDEKTVVVEDGQGTGVGGGGKEVEKKASNFMALKTVAMEADENKEDLGETGLTNIADDSELSTKEKESKKEKKGEDKKGEKEDDNKDEEEEEKEEGKNKIINGVEVPETIQDQADLTKPEDDPLYAPV
ncbi:unnamed protein product [Meloidogyne enterolobii]|uniref:Uncharacterized protein n=1 Tax=Meloidogyne enterolobii TaxID=390850 RepID=A0ACB0Y3V2_MELEN